MALRKASFCLSNSLKEIPNQLREKVSILKGTPQMILDSIHARGYGKLYIDGGTTIQQFLQADLIDELRITTIPILLGGGYSLFGELADPMELEHVQSKVYLNQIVQDWYRRKR